MFFNHINKNPPPVDDLFLLLKNGGFRLVILSGKNPSSKWEQIRGYIS